MNLLQELIERECCKTDDFYDLKLKLDSSRVGFSDLKSR